MKAFLKRLRRLLYYRPRIVLEWSGQCTDNPRTHVSVQYNDVGAKGGMTLMTFDKDVNGDQEGLARMYGKDIARVFDASLVDWLDVTHPDLFRRAMKGDKKCQKNSQMS